MNSDWEAYYLNQISELSSELYDAREILEILKKKWVSPKNFRLTCYVMNNYKWIEYESYKKSYMNYYEDDEYLLTETEFNLIKGWLES